MFHFDGHAVLSLRQLETIFGSDEEYAIVRALQATFPQMQHVFCAGPLCYSGRVFIVPGLNWAKLGMYLEVLFYCPGKKFRVLFRARV